MTLAELKPGQSAKLGELDAIPALSTKLIALGLLPGDTITVTACPPFGGPIAIKFGNNNFFAIRKNEAKKIPVSII